MRYYDDTGKYIRPELLNEEAQQAARQFVQLQGNKVIERDSIKNSQLRRFFNEFKNLERQLAQRQGEREEVFRSIKPLVKMANAKVAYARARKVVPEAFVSWLQKHVQTIETARDFEAFVLHFEAVVGFCYGLNPKD
ncbi:type III-A CRISPR-associated protein Csm2 [Syntrophotalea acetylenica]|jgi:CRISPR-associated protein Csm2|uniref:type III-A CRISPR-associated protein Csm2 n=1 Tax=Syntrophotalea acetylenica TaxID=29542 RepID=UPI002A35E79A|nr:type III-A CRISPR-associated protein Csm2 [Syntrophotalea acetylenica]MDY0261379.1 type III-A CRISPR-associated protein Csm2 [Syntrophotalea acetylenica]